LRSSWIQSGRPRRRGRATDTIERGRQGRSGGFQAIGASTADEAIHVLELRNDIGAVFTDVHMPGSMDGLALIRLIAGRWPSIAALVTSGKVDLAPADLPRGARLFAKPWWSIQIEAALRQLIG
jgi:DNA-binding NtrC family response regulator